jgi:hypothetical protein
MAFKGPDLSDYQNVVSLNLAWLDQLQQDSRLEPGLTGLPEMHRRRIGSLTRRQIAHLATTPFLLFSFRECDDRYWTQILEERPERDLFTTPCPDEADMLISASLGFIWQLARGNPYSLRVICGATLYWTERIAELTFYALLDAVRSSGDVPIARFADEGELWRKLLDSGVSGDSQKRHAAQISALQSILTTPPDSGAQNWSLAARKANSPQLRVAENSQPRNR